MLQGYIQLLPKGTVPINDHVGIYRHDDQVEFYTASGPIFSCREDDSFGMRLAQSIIVKETDVKPGELAKAIGVDRATIYRNLKKYSEGGASALIIDKGDRGPYKLSKEKTKQVQKFLNEGRSLRKAAVEAGITEGCIRYAIKKGIITRSNYCAKESARRAKSSSERSAEDSNCTIGVGAKREDERVIASLGKLEEAKPCFTPSEGVRHAGVLLALPVLACLGLLDAGNKVYASLRNGYYGLQSVLLTLCFMALLRIKNPEQLKSRSPGELGIILGLDRCPEVKTLRRKLKELGLRNKAGDLISILSKRWTDADKDTIGYAYIDGHVRPYNGRKHKLPKTHVARRRLCMPATTDFWVNDKNCEPLFLVTAKANDSLLSMLNEEIIPELRTLAGDGVRVTLIFDREGWSPESFERWFKAGFDVITYRKGKYDPWPRDYFTEVKSNVRGEPVSYLLGERSIQVKKDFWMREVRRLCDDGHQTSIMTTRQDLDFEQIARRMFSRWNQENFFRYMREEYALDHLVTNNVEPADVERLVPNPDKKEKRKAIANLKRQLEKHQAEYGRKDQEDSDLKDKISSLEKELEQSKGDLRQIPNRVAIKELLSEHEIVRLESERKMLTDAIKMTCYRAETWLFSQIGQHFSRNHDEGRAFLKAVFQQPADIIPDEGKNILNVKFHTMANPRSNQALRKLCETINEHSFVYPGTIMRLQFQAPDVASEFTRGQEP